MKKKRVFIAIDLPPNVKNSLEIEVAELVKLLPAEVRFLSSENWHITLTFLGYQSDEDIGNIITALEAVTPQINPPEINFNKITYGPPDKLARMIWLTTDNQTLTNLAKIKKTLENELANKGIRFPRELREFHSHITLARFEGIPQNLLPSAEKDLSLKFTAPALNLMESKLKRTDAEYSILTSVDFKKEMD